MSPKHSVRLLVATGNPGKAKEYQEILANLPVDITWLEAEGIRLEVEETGHTFEENAILKAKTYARLSGLLTWADDSGLEVDALNGWPGVASARHAGPTATDAERTQILLQKMASVPYEERTAVFRCVVAVASPNGDVFTASGSRSGIIAFKPSGDDGFGYDPVFYIPECLRTYAELSPDEKHALSHRGEAARKARVLLEQYLEDKVEG